MSAMRTLMTSLLLIAIVPCLAQAGPADRAKQAVISKMNTKRVSMEFSDAPLTDVVEFLRSVTQINMMVDPAVVREKPDMRVTLNVKDVKVRNVLNLIGQFFALTADIREGGVVVLTEKERIKSAYVTKVYDIRDLMFAVKDFRGPKIGLNKSGQTPSVTFEYDDADKSRVISGPEALVELIQTNMGDAWEGEKANVSVVRGLLVATNTKQVHQQVKRLLQMLRATR